MVICQNCKKETPAGKFCENCGAVLQAPQTFQQPPQEAAQAKNKNPILALILSLIICGVGQMYNGQVLKGIVLLAACLIMYFIFWGISFIIVIYAMYDAYTTAVKINNGEAVETWTTRA